MKENKKFMYFIEKSKEYEKEHNRKMIEDPQYREIRYLRGENARLSIQLSLVEDIIFDEEYEPDSYYHDYGTSLHERLWEKFRK